ncbi:MAG: glycosyltransferase N-terminal domain-containing protein, partial [Muribaculaceae bacterium]|nr:glycosyltransferase N-terminal domain-containing protein [Muribaculaceae bacterium]
MNWLYNTGIRLYSAAAKAGALKSKKIATMIQGQSDTMLRLKNDLADLDRPIWVHAASLGEFEQGRTLIERIRSEHPQRQILLSFFSPSGYEVR